MQILIIEDEARAANQLQKLLSQCGFEHRLLDIIDTVEDSVDWFLKNEAPDLVFMDIQLADGLSFEIFQNVSVQCPIIFTTAFDQYAIKAFKVNSVDYLLKPIQQDLLSNALDKFSSQQQQAIDVQVVQRMLAELQAPNHRKGILVKEGSGFIQIPISELLYAYSEDSITFGISNSKRFIIEETIDELMNSLNPSEFFRINRGQIVAKKAIQKIDKYFNHRLKLSVQAEREDEFIVSRPKTTEFKNWLNQ
ncbi:response regulator transcription factor [Muricauda sp. DJ-13]|uniref:Response regulator transcription factor n=1 Tax=Croceivirga thetidis TaxID=2721623 RepID=A0ABX1GTK7_9FLAO|nr:response regulator transcription factor [Croceivirga thetidis]